MQSSHVSLAFCHTRSDGSEYKYESLPPWKKKKNPPEHTRCDPGYLQANYVPAETVTPFEILL